MPHARDADSEDGGAAVLARAAGLHRAWAEHRAEVEEVVSGLPALRAAFSRPSDPAAEPSPPFAVPGARGEGGR